MSMDAAERRVLAAPLPPLSAATRLTPLSTPFWVTRLKTPPAFPKT